MVSLGITKRDEMTMRLVHYFVTQENYQPIVVNGLENEIWLENTQKKYEVIRINNNYIHNNEQLDFDIFKTKTVIKQIKKKMLSINCPTIDILLNVGDNVDITKSKTPKNIEIIAIPDEESYEDSDIHEIFPLLKEDKVEAEDEMDFFINITNDINSKTEEKNKIYEKTFKKKPIVFSYVIIAINILVFIVNNIILQDTYTDLFSMNAGFLREGEFWRLITAAFFHLDIIHLGCNMYALYVLGEQIETILGKKKFIFVYFISAIIGNLLSGAINGQQISSIGASGAIFGLMGALVYFGYHYRLYLGNVVIGQIAPVIIINLALSIAIPGIDIWGHVGGLIGGILATMIVGVEGKSDKTDRINGSIVTAIIIGLLIFVIFNPR